MPIVSWLSTIGCPRPDARGGADEGLLLRAGEDRAARRVVAHDELRQHRAAFALGLSSSRLSPSTKPSTTPSSVPPSGAGPSEPVTSAPFRSRAAFSGIVDAGESHPHQRVAVAHLVGSARQDLDREGGVACPGAAGNADSASAARASGTSAVEARVRETRLRRFGMLGSSVEKPPYAVADSPVNAYPPVRRTKSTTARARSPPRSSWRKWPPPRIVGCGRPRPRGCASGGPSSSRA